MPNWDRLSALDASFLGVEDGNTHMHVAAIMKFEPGSFVSDDGRLDINRLRQFIESKLHLVPRYRQKLMFVPGEGHPVWVDDDRFNSEYHVRHTALPFPGEDADLEAFMGRVMSSMLDRSKPLWEIWFVEGFHDGSIIMLSKVHHCMVDGIAGTDIMQALLNLVPEDEIARPVKWTPRPAPKGAQLAVDAIRHRLEQPIENIAATRKALRNPKEAFEQAQHYVESFAELFAPGLRAAAETPLNGKVGPHRRFNWIEMQLEDVKAVKNVLGGTVNDVVLATVSGAIRKFFKARKFSPTNLDVRALVPVSVRTEAERGEANNRVASMVAQLPIGVKDPVKRLRTVSETMGGLKESKQAIGAERLAAVADWAAPNLLVQAVRITARQRAYNCIVTNVPGPQIPLYMHDALMTAAYPLVPIFPQQGLGIALMSYNGKLCWGLNGDWDIMHDLDVMRAGIEEAFAELQDAAGTLAKTPANKKTATRKSAAPKKRKSTPKRQTA